MAKRLKFALLAVAALAGALVCFVFSYGADPLAFKLCLFVAGALLVLGALVTLTHLAAHLLAIGSSKVFLNLFMLVASLVFSMLANYSTNIMGIDEGTDLLDASVMFLLAFVFVVACSITTFRKLREYADSFYTAVFTATFATLSALFYLFGPILPDNELLDGLRLFTVVGSLSLALSLFMIEWGKRRAQR